MCKTLTLKIITIKTWSEKDPDTDVTHPPATAGDDESQPNSLLHTGGVLSTLSDHGMKFAMVCILMGTSESQEQHHQSVSFSVTAFQSLQSG